MLDEVKAMRKDYGGRTLYLEGLPESPFVQFERWFQEAVECQLPEPNAMTLATASAKGIPSARVVLLKGVDKTGFQFYTNYNSRKGQQLAKNPHAAVVFLWHGLQRQVRIEGKVEKLTEEASTAYFQSRPKGSQIGAWASPQSEIIDGRETLENRVEALNEKYESAEVLPKPPHWGGYCLKPHRIEFWQGRSSRLHDRIEYTLNGDGSWQRKRLAP